MNKFLGIGRLTRDPQISNGNDSMVARYTLAVDRAYKKEGEPNADFISCVAFGKSADFAEKYLCKGKKIAVEGRIRTGSYTNKDGQKVYTTDVVVDRHEFVEGKGAEDGTTPSGAPTENNDNAFVNVPENMDEELPFG